MATIAPNAWITSTRLNGPVVYARRLVTWQDGPVAADGGSVEIMAGAASALAPLITKTIVDVPFADYQRADTVTVLGEIGVPLALPIPTFQVTRVMRVPAPFPHVEVALASVDYLFQPATWLPHIGPQTPNAVPDTDWDPLRQQVATANGPSYGTGWMMTVAGVLYHGYLPGVPVSVGINEYAVSTEVTADALVVDEHPVVISLPGQIFTKGDVLVLQDGRRLEIEDLLHRFQRYGVLFAILQMASWRQPGDVSYTIPLTGGSY